jgi:hypothetical protein
MSKIAETIATPSVNIKDSNLTGIKSSRDDI